MILKTNKNKAALYIVILIISIAALIINFIKKEYFITIVFVLIIVAYSIRLIKLNKN